MRILITNDDGYSAAGIRALALWARKLGDVTVIAPKVEQSGKSHAIDFTRPIEIKEVDEIPGVRTVYVDSTPADCVRYAILGEEKNYDLVLSGINRGVNMGVDLVYSGTCGAIFEAGRLDHKGIAFFKNHARMMVSYHIDVKQNTNGGKFTWPVTLLTLVSSAARALTTAPWKLSPRATRSS